MYPLLKRVLDIALAIAVLIVFAPVLIALAVWIKLGDGGPILYAGTRAGRGDVPFRMLKFRTMVVDAERLGPSSTSDSDARITRAGAFMRRLKLDELPQLFNVLGGTMSFVGPRPQVQWAVDRYTASERELLSVRPGITDFASLRFRNEGEILRGSTDPDRDYLEKIAPLKIRLGLHYVHTYSLVTDVTLIVATALSAVGVDPSWCLPRGELAS